MLHYYLWFLIALFNNLVHGMRMQCLIYFHILQYIEKYNTRDFLKNICMVHRIDTWICKAVTRGLHYNMSNVWVFRTGLVLPHEFGSGELQAWVSHATKVRKGKALTVVIPASLNSSDIQGQTSLRSYPIIIKFGLAAYNSSTIPQVSCQQIAREFNFQESKNVCACACVKSCTSQRPKWTFLIQMTSFLLIWNLFLKKCDEICGNGKVSFSQYFTKEIDKYHKWRSFDQLWLKCVLFEVLLDNKTHVLFYN